MILREELIARLDSLLVKPVPDNPLKTSYEYYLQKCLSFLRTKGFYVFIPKKDGDFSKTFPILPRGWGICIPYQWDLSETEFYSKYTDGIGPTCHFEEIASDNSFLMHYAYDPENLDKLDCIKPEELLLFLDAKITTPKLEFAVKNLKKEGA